MKQIALIALCVLTVQLATASADELRLQLPEGSDGGVAMPSDAPVFRSAGRVLFPDLTGGSPLNSIQPPSLSIPTGKFGISLNDGTKIIGVPKTNVVTVRTTFGNAAIPREQIAKIETANGVTRVFLKNGDRVSGKWVTTVIQFETQFGVLKVPVASLVWLRTSNAGVTTKPAKAPTQAIDRALPEPTRRFRAIIGGDASADAP